MNPEENTKCTCNVDNEEHSCAYQCEINDDDEFTCHCCPYCTHECAMDI